MNSEKTEALTREELANMRPIEDWYHVDDVDRIVEALESAWADLEQCRVQLAGCGVAALGGTKDPAKCGDYGWSASYQDVLDLRLKLESAWAENERLRAIIADYESLRMTQ